MTPEERKQYAKAWYLAKKKTLTPEQKVAQAERGKLYRASLTAEQRAEKRRKLRASEKIRRAPRSGATGKKAKGRRAAPQRG